MPLHNDPVRAGAVRAAKANGGAGVWHYQTGDGLEAVLAQRPGQGHGRVDISDLGVEREADGCFENGGVRAFTVSRPCRGVPGRALWRH